MRLFPRLRFELVPRLRFGLVVAALIATSAGSCRLALAESGSVHQLAGAGLSLVLDTRWVDAPGYRPVKIAVTPTIPNLAERTLSVELAVSRNWGYDYDFRAVKEMELPAGSGSVETILSVPNNVVWNSYKINVRENGKIINGLSPPQFGVNNSAGEFCEVMPWILIVGDGLPNTEHLRSVVPRSEYGNFSSTGGELPTAISRRVKELPEKWIDYTSLDIVCLSLDQLNKLKTQQREALLRWTHAGGNLWVYGIGKQWKRIEELDQLAGLPSIPLGEPPDLIGSSDVIVPSQITSATQDWRFPPYKLFDWSRRGGSGTYRRDSWSIEERFDQQGKGSIRIKSRPKTRKGVLPEQFEQFKNPHFVLRYYGFGQITAMAAESPFPGTKAEWSWVFGAVGMDRCLAYNRDGVSMNRMNAEFLDFLIPGVGLAPVTEFCVLITFFVLAIGPLNFLLLRRWKRLHLLVVTIPVSALTVTLLLFAYAVVSDGLGTRVRVRSVTQIDQRRGEAACRARLSYYSGMAPSRGLTFKKDTAVMPLEEMPTNGRFGHSRGLRRDVIWGENQWLASGWLSSRKPTQYLTTRSRTTDDGLDLIDAGGHVRVKNRLGTPIKQLAICAEDGTCYWAENVAADATVPVEPLEPAKIRARMNMANVDNRPAPPEGASGSGGGFFGPSRRSRYYWYGGGNTYLDEPSQSTSRLERSIASIGLVDASTRDEMPAYGPRSYVAIVDRSPEVALGVASATEESSYHVILGKW